MGDILDRGGLEVMEGLLCDVGYVPVLQAVARGVSPGLRKLALVSGGGTFEHRRRLPLQALEALGAAMAASFCRHLQELEILQYVEEDDPDHDSLPYISGALIDGACPALSKLDLCGCTTTPADWQAFVRLVESGRLSQLEHLLLDGQTYGESPTMILEALESQTWPKLTNLDYNGFNIDRVAADLVANVVTAAPSLRSLHVDWYDPSAGLRLLERIREATLPGLRRLDLHSCSVDEAHFRVLGDILRMGRLPSLQSLELDSWISGTGDHLVHVIRALGERHCSNITKLGFGSTMLGDEGCEALIQLLSQGHLRKLKELDVSSSDPISGDVMTRLVDEMRACLDLRSLCVAYSGMGEEAIHALHCVIGENVWSKLECLELSYEDKEQVEELAALLADPLVARRLKELRLWGPYPAPEDHDLFHPLAPPLSLGACPELKLLGIRVPDEDEGTLKLLQLAVRGRNVRVEEI